MAARVILEAPDLEGARAAAEAALEERRGDDGRWSLGMLRPLTPQAPGTHRYRAVFSLWQATDSLLCSFVNAGSDWAATPLTLELDGGAPLLFVLGDVAPLASPDRVFEPEVPLYGCQYHSANDGPRDVPLGGSQTFTISNSGLRLVHTPLGARYSVGQPLALRATVTNLLAAPVDSVLGTLVHIENPALVTLDSAVAGPVDLSAGGTADFVWYYTAAQPGNTFWRLRAEGSLKNACRRLHRSSNRG